MANKLNTDTKDSLSKEMKRIQQRCIDTRNIIENTLDISLHQDNVANSALSYVEGLRNEIVNSNTVISTDDNLITSQFLAEMKIKTEQVDELIAFTKGNIFDTDREIERLQSITKTAKEALSRPRVVHRDVRPEHLQKAKETFQILKNELQGLIQSLFPQLSDDIVDVMGQLMQEKLNEESNGYIEITNENYRIVELLSDMNIVTANPYNNMEVKLAF
ncbi:uncharacterized protein LOC119828569 [Zerene cesonia]|uniref:uncharacterized protein LOC119828569 n=1 Tax=Zerene cesonia TaxID=33412 RepID=UPI0018E4F4C1|nr:uncharacterized protein LOC119828569 [Zerene cesonia]